MIARLPAVLAGLWLMAAPAVLDYGRPLADSDRAVGPVIAGLAFVAVWPIARSLRWATVPLGAWLLVAPWVLGDAGAAAAANDVACGLVTLLTAPLGGATSRSFGGGWRALVGP